MFNKKMSADKLTNDLLTKTGRLMTADDQLNQYLTVKDYNRISDLSISYINTVTNKNFKKQALEERILIQERAEAAKATATTTALVAPPRISRSTTAPVAPPKKGSIKGVCRYLIFIITVLLVGFIVKKTQEHPRLIEDTVVLDLKLPVNTTLLNSIKTSFTRNSAFSYLPECGSIKGFKSVEELYPCLIAVSNNITFTQRKINDPISINFNNTELSTFPVDFINDAMNKSNNTLVVKNNTTVDNLFIQPKFITDVAQFKIDVDTHTEHETNKKNFEENTKKIEMEKEKRVSELNLAKICFEFLTSTDSNITTMLETFATKLTGWMNNDSWKLKIIGQYEKLYENSTKPLEDGTKYNNSFFNLIFLIIVLANIYIKLESEETVPSPASTMTIEEIEDGRRFKRRKSVSRKILSKKKSKRKSKSRSKSRRRLKKSVRRDRKK